MTGKRDHYASAQNLYERKRDHAAAQDRKGGVKGKGVDIGGSGSITEKMKGGGREKIN